LLVRSRTEKAKSLLVFAVFEDLPPGLFCGVDVSDMLSESPGYSAVIVGAP